MNSMVGKIATYGTLGVIPGMVVLSNPKTEKGEKVKNRVTSTAGLVALGVTPSMVKDIVARKPELAGKVYAKTGTLLEKAGEYVAKKAPVVFKKIRSTKVGKKVTNKIIKGMINVLEKWEQNPSMRSAKIADKVANALEKFAKMPTAQKGKVGLIVAGIALLTTAAVKLFKNHYKKEGAIEKKYDDLEVKYNRMVEAFPIKNARTGEVISFEEYCKMVQTPLK